MKKQVIINISYVVEIEQDEFWNKDSGYLNEEVKATLDHYFPHILELSKDIQAKREILSYIPVLNHHIAKCPMCKRFMTYGGKPNPMMILRDSIEIDGIRVCSSCVWELDFDIKHGKSIKKLIEEANQNVSDDFDE